MWSCSFTCSVQDLTFIRAFSGREQGCGSVIGTHDLWWRGGQYCVSQQLDLLSAWHASPAVFQSFFLLVYYLVSPSDSIPGIWCGIGYFMGLRVYLGSFGFKVLDNIALEQWWDNSKWRASLSVHLAPPVHPIWWVLLISCLIHCTSQVLCAGVHGSALKSKMFPGCSEWWCLQ